MHGAHPIQLDTMIINPYRFAGDVDPGTPSHYWALQETTGNRVDTIGGKDLDTLVDTRIATAAGVHGNAVDDDFVGGNNHKNTSFAPPSTTYSVNFWCRYDTVLSSTYGWWLVANRGSTAASVNFQINMDNTGAAPEFRFTMYDGTTNVPTTITDFDPADYLAGDWFMVTLVVDKAGAQEVSFWIDGVKSADTYDISSVTPKITAEAFGIGPVWSAVVSSTNFEWRGGVDEIRLFNKALTQSEINFLKNNPSGAAPANPGTTDLLAWWGLDEAASPTTWVDDYDSNADNRYDLTKGGTVTSATGNVSGGADIDSTASSTNRLYNSNAVWDTLDSNPFSVSFWVKGNGTDNWYGAGVLSAAAGSTRHWRIDMPNSLGTIRFLMLNTAPTVFTTSSDATTYDTSTSWHHVVGVMESDGTLNLYIDGVAQSTPDTFTGTHTTGSEPLEIGRALGGTLTGDAIYDEVGIFTDALTPAEVLWLYNSGSGRAYSDL
jgi:hypothetical protein